MSASVKPVTKCFVPQYAAKVGIVKTKLGDWAAAAAERARQAELDPGDIADSAGRRGRGGSRCGAAGTGAILAVRDTRQDPAGERFMDWMHPLHNGEAFGLVGRVLACVGGLLPVLLLVTGWLRWRHKRAARRLTAVRRAAAI